MKKKIVLTGAGGFIGKAITAQLLKNDCEVIGLTRKSNNRVKTGSADSEIQWVQWDGKSFTGWEKHLDGSWAVINLAGENIGAGRWTKTKKKKIISSRIDAGKALSDAIEKIKNKPELFIQASAVGFYGSREDEALKEDSPAGQGFLPEVVRQWEAATEAVETMGVRRLILRIGMVLGLEGGALPRMMLPFRFFIGGRIGSGNQWVSWIQMDDLVQAIVFLMNQTGEKGIFNLTAPNPVTNKTFAQTLGKVLKRPSLMPVPGFVLKLIFGQMAEEILLAGQRVIPHRLLELGFSFTYPQLPSALERSLKNG